MNEQSCHKQTQINIEQLNCWLMDDELVMPMFWSNMIIAISYFIIPLTIFIMLYAFRHLLTNRQKIILFMFIVFILLCGIGHVIKVYNFWLGNFELELLIDKLTALVSIFTAFATSILGYRILKAYLYHKELLDQKAKNILIILGAFQSINNKK